MCALALIIRGAGLGFLFTPINNVAYASLKPSEAQQASGLINLARQLGGSFGIAILATYVTVHTQFHRVDLLANIYPGQPSGGRAPADAGREPGGSRLWARCGAAGSAGAAGPGNDAPGVHAEL